ncbi:uncharacterized protein LOC111241002 [Vigna radiata var. radiata]|uniref:Uncharacterized protein LOC111241002 n=1 Tax=Vigna radiata var. radiata TaxID=3916 RepID=A0A3Q0EMZ2_VIGRR|nr:uncharacterized protein LOC111241002 [Vigna radiata var. radiata]
MKQEPYPAIILRHHASSSLAHPSCFSLGPAYNAANRRVVAAKCDFFVFATIVPKVSALQCQKDPKCVFFISVSCSCSATTSRVITSSSLPERVASPPSIGSTRPSFPPASGTRSAASLPRDSEPNIINGVWSVCVDCGFEESH